MMIVYMINHIPPRGFVLVVFVARGRGLGSQALGEYDRVMSS